MIKVIYTKPSVNHLDTRQLLYNPTHDQQGIIGVSLITFQLYTYPLIMSHLADMVVGGRTLTLLTTKFF